MIFAVYVNVNVNHSTGTETETVSEKKKCGVGGTVVGIESFQTQCYCVVEKWTEKSAAKMKMKKVGEIADHCCHCC